MSKAQFSQNNLPSISRKQLINNVIVTSTPSEFHY